MKRKVANVGGESLVEEIFSFFLSSVLSKPKTGEKIEKRERKKKVSS